MRPFLRPLLIALSLLTTVALAIPVDTRIPRSSRICSNAPPTVAGTLLAPRAPPSPLDANNFIYCERGTRTYVVIKIGWAASNGDILRSLLTEAYNLAVSRIAAHGDSVATTSLAYGLIGSIVYMTEREMVLRVANANNHQTTWGVLGAAMRALANFVSEHGGFNMADFAIYDGDNQVAVGVLTSQGRE